MMSTKHTPGPWGHKTRESSWGTIDDGICGPDGEQVRVHGMTLSSSEEAKANARLISAAPDLLEALKVVFVIGDRCVSDIYGYEFKMKARAAIAKATGAKA
jgi:hypothetical protein